MPCFLTYQRKCVLLFEESVSMGSGDENSLDFRPAKISNTDFRTAKIPGLDLSTTKILSLGFSCTKNIESSQV